MAKVLISAYACRPGTGSEPGVGWNFVVHAAEAGHDVWVMTRPDNRPSIDAALATEQSAAVKGIRFVYVDWGGLSGRLPGKLVHARYWRWQAAARKVAHALHAEVGGFDVAHHVTYVCYWQGTSLAELNVPIVWGPVGGGESAPAGLVADLGVRGRVLERVRGVARALGERTPGVRRVAARAAVALATTEETAARLRALGARRVEIFTAIGLSAAEVRSLGAVPPVTSADVARGVRFVSSGRLLDWKGFHLGLRAFAAARLPAGSRYDVIGDGPAMPRLRQLAGSLGVADRVHFAGHLARDEAMALLSRAHALIHPSLHDSGGLVCLEAMAMGKPVLCLNLGGPAVVVDERSGARVTAVTSDGAVSDLAGHMTRWAADPQWLAAAGAAARERARTVFAWPTRMRDMSDLYARVMSENEPDRTTDARGDGSPGRPARAAPLAGRPVL